MLLAILRAYEADILTLKQAKEILRTLENFHVQFTAVTAQRTGGGTAFMYALGARQLLQATSSNKAAQSLKVFKGKLRDRVPSLEEFEAGFVEIRYTSDNPKQHKLVKYILSRIDQHARKDAEIDYDAMTIEHLAPQKPAAASGLSLEAVGMLGNMILVPKGLNSKLANKSLDKKLVALKAASVPLDESISSAATWDDSGIRQRTKALAALGHSKVFAL